LAHGLGREPGRPPSVTDCMRVLQQLAARAPCRTYWCAACLKRLLDDPAWRRALVHKIRRAAGGAAAAPESLAWLRQATKCAQHAAERNGGMCLCRPAKEWVKCLACRRGGVQWWYAGADYCMATEESRKACRCGDCRAPCAWQDLADGEEEEEEAAAVDAAAAKEEEDEQGAGAGAGR
jgi:hypothetical protein